MGNLLWRSVMSSKLDIAIQENILKPHTVQTFLNQVYIRKSNDAIIADSLEEFMNKITDPCHLWIGQKHPDGYGGFTIYSKGFGKKFTVKAHRFAYALAYGFEHLPVGLEGGINRFVINHLCHNRACVNPKHLEVITNDQNVSREKRKPKNV